ncbi:putative beta-lysine N-acetyltransferase [Desulfuromusa kysingii]|uniref:Putative beta-lysine N-acetyltransferase n=1 Tax=Desulfuromusa kysingii TaxID=37625 RepID=A0A1H4AW62_9BACT|nr:putative beta-lysine N-acetyltransferase [Desulfuromusa kysingii]SEA40097.1 putative beta-lysine N-acetyltransferase [Desulfuromusa kysingii]
MSHDVITRFGQSVIQHGPENDRVYLMKLAEDDLPEVITNIKSLAARHNYSKAFVKVPQSAQSQFADHGYRVEAEVPGLFKGRENGAFMAYYFHPERRLDPAADRVEKVLEVAGDRSKKRHMISLPTGCDCQLATPDHCQQMAKLYRETFASYPFPIHDPQYLTTTMADNVVYAGIWQGDQLLALASAETDLSNSNAELTDFATDGHWRGQGLASILLQYLEAQLQSLRIKTCYTIARALSYGMNICFAQNGYKFAGTLVKNTQISGSLESMNVWHKRAEVTNSAHCCRPES